jgi:hypothetical protein
LIEDCAGHGEGMPGRVRTNPRVRRELITYLGAAALVLVLVAFGAALVGRQVAEAEGVRDAQRVGQRTADLVVGPLLRDILNGDRSRRAELDRAVVNRCATARSPSWWSETAAARSSTPATSTASANACRSSRR